VLCWMLKGIPWVGHKNAFENHSRHLREDGDDVRDFYDTKHGLDYLEGSEAPLVLMSFWLNNAHDIGFEADEHSDIDVPYQVSIFTLKKIREMDRHKKTPIVVAGAVHNTEWNGLYRGAGANDIVDLANVTLGEFERIVAGHLGVRV